MWFVYFLKVANKDWYYVGSTNDVLRRVGEHDKGLVTSTKHHRPLTLVHTICFDLEQEARQYEREVKHQRKEKEKIIRWLKEHCRLV